MLDLTIIRKGLYEAKCLLEDRVPARYRGYALNAVEGAMDVLNSNMNFVWHRFRKDSIPACPCHILLWLDYQHCGFPVAARYMDGRVQFYNHGGLVDWQVTPNKGEFARVLWAYIPTPAGEDPQEDPAACSFPGNHADPDAEVRT